MNREAEMSAPLIEYWSGLGYTVYCEVPFSSRSIDMVAVSDDKVVVIEMKKSFTKHLLYQLRISAWAAHASYGAVSSRPRASSVDAAGKNGFGILLVQSGSVETICEPSIKGKLKDYAFQNIRMNAELQYLGGVAGLPNLKGVGPAQAVAREVRQYREHRPAATWLELFKEIPNHYASMKSMRGALTSRGLV